MQEQHVSRIVDIGNDRLAVELKSAQGGGCWGLEGARACVLLTLTNNTRFVVSTESELSAW
jgi:hypothetical protein